MTSPDNNNLTHYTTSGNVCGSCGHKHRTPYAAHDCAKQHQRGIKSRNGRNSYSDRHVYEVYSDGTKKRVYFDEDGHVDNGW